MKKLNILIIVVLFPYILYSQNIIEMVLKHNLTAIGNNAIKKVIKKTGTTCKLTTFIYFHIALKNSFQQQSGTFDDFIDNLVVYNYPSFFIYNDSCNIIMGDWGKKRKRVINTYVGSWQLSLIKYIESLNPDFVFNYCCPDIRYFPLYLCYKNNDIIFVYYSDKDKEIISFLLSELKDWRWLNIGGEIYQ